MSASLSSSSAIAVSGPVLPQDVVDMFCETVDYTMTVLAMENDRIAAHGLGHDSLVVDEQLSTLKQGAIETLETVYGQLHVRIQENPISLDKTRIQRKLTEFNAACEENFALLSRAQLLQEQVIGMHLTAGKSSKDVSYTKQGYRALVALPSALISERT